jgi:hypothetical protein
MEASKLLCLTMSCPVEAIAYPPTGEPYLTQLLPGTPYSVLELTVETLTLGRIDAGPEVYLICFTLADWSYFVFTIVTQPSPNSALRPY